MLPAIIRVHLGEPLPSRQEQPEGAALDGNARSIEDRQMTRNHWMSLLAVLVMSMTSTGTTALAAEADDHRADQRARIVEFSLKDLATSNDRAIGAEKLSVQPGTDALQDPKVQIRPAPEPDSRELVARNVQSSLHKLYRENVSERTPDGRKDRVQESQARQAEAAASADDPAIREAAP
jgi:hypothetical protein